MKIMTKKEIIDNLKLLKNDKDRAAWVLEEKMKLKEYYEEFQDILTDKTEKIIYDVLSEDIGLKHDIKRWIIMGKRYEDWIQRFKTVITLDGMVADEEVKGLFRLARFEIRNLRADKARIIRETMETRRDIKKMKLQIYIYEQISTLKTDSQKQKAMILCEGCVAKGEVNSIVNGVKNG